MATSLLAFAAFAAILTITPGVDTLLVLRAAASSGRVAGIAAAVGIGLGCLAWAMVSAAGLTALVTTSQIAFDALRIAGAAYLCWLGARALWFARRPAPASGEAATGSDLSAAGAHGADARVGAGAGGPRFERWSAGRALRVGLTTNLLNPKVGAFYLSVLPQFLPDGLHPLAGSLALAMIHNIEGLLWLSMLAVLVTRARSWLTRPAVRRRFEQVTGAVLLALGLRLAIDH